MASGVSAASNAVSAAVAAYDRAAGGVVSSANSDSDSSPSVGDMAGAIVQMDTSRIALAAVLMAVRTSNDMLAAAINIGGYGATVGA